MMQEIEIEFENFSKSDFTRNSVEHSTGTYTHSASLVAKLGNKDIWTLTGFLSMSSKSFGRQDRAPLAIVIQLGFIREIRNYLLGLARQ